jgi:uncharacterized membrane protein
MAPPGNRGPGRIGKAAVMQSVPMAEIVQPSGPAPAPAPAGAARGGSVGVLVNSGFIMAAIVLLAIALVVVRRRFLGPDQQGEDARAMADVLRSLKDSGEISPEKFNAAQSNLAKSMIAGKKNAGPDKRQPPSSGPRGGGSHPVRPRPDRL